MIYCVVPSEMADELYDRLEDYYADDPNVKVIVDRRRRNGPGGPPNGGHPPVRERRRPRVPGDFPPVVVGSE